MVFSCDDAKDLHVKGAVPRLCGRARCVWPALLKGVAKQLKSAIKLNLCLMKRNLQVTEPKLGN